ncbi:MAG: amidase domain-containing protein [Gorillibacterium sp.]|nr:amidase domain-containing protein [Gorillibacterium sp.]
MEAQYDPALIASYIEDEQYHFMQKERMARLNQLHYLRRVEPVRRELRLRILHARRVGEELEVVIGLHGGFEYRCNGQFHREEKKETETLILASRRGRWSIAAVHQLELDGTLEAEAFVSDTTEQPVATEGPTRIGALTTSLAEDRTGRFIQPVRAIPYNRKRAAEYADRYWEAGNPAYLEFAVNCSNYVSQCIFAGGAPMNYTNKRGTGWWYRGKSGSQELWSYSWAVADSLKRFLSGSRAGLQADLVDSPQQLAEGDVISYSWRGNGHYGHSTVVAAMDGNGMPLVNAHTVSSKHRYWDYKDSYAWTKNTQYRFFHISDSLH